MSLQQLINFLVQNDTGPQNKLIKGTWHLTGQVLEETGYKNKEFQFKKVDHNLIIDQASGVNEDFFMVHSSPNSGEQKNNTISYLPGIIIQSSPLIIQVSVNQDNGVFRLVEQKRNSDGEVNVMSGTLIEAGYSKESILQKPTVGKVMMRKINTDNTLPLLGSLQQPFTKPNIYLRPSQLYYSTNQFFENIKQDDPDYTIELVAPLLNSKGEVVGYMTSTNIYTKYGPTTICVADIEYNIYTDKHNVDATVYNNSNPYTPLGPESVRATFCASMHYQGTLNQSKYLGGKLTVPITKTTGDLPQTFATVYLTIDGRVDGIRVIDCDHIAYLMSK